MPETVRSTGHIPEGLSRILVTGADGFVGGHLVPRLAGLLGRDGSIVTTTRNPVAAADDVVHFDLEDHAGIARVIETVRPDLIVHLAAQASVGQSSGDAARTWSANFSASMAMAQAIAAHAPETIFFFPSSAEVYGATFNQERASETSALRPASPYARSKAAAEAVLADVLPSSCRLIVARAANHTGSGQSDAFVVPAFAAQIIAVERGIASSIQVGNLDSGRDFLSVDDVVRAYVLLLMRAATLPMRSVFNVASGETVRIRDLLHRLLSLAGQRPRIEPDPARMRPSEVPVARLDNAALRALGWTPSPSLDPALVAVLEDQRRRWKVG